MKDSRSESASEASSVPARATQDACTLAREWAWVDRSLWTERMLAALDNGVKGNFAAPGLFTMTEARLLASQSR